MIIGSLAPPLSAFSAYGVGTQATAHNLANVLSNNFKAGRVIYSDLPSQLGVRASPIESGATAGTLVPYDLGLPESPVQNNPPVPEGFVVGSTTDVAREMINLIVNSHTYQANARTVSASDEMLGTIINMKV